MSAAVTFGILAKAMWWRAALSLLFCKYRHSASLKPRARSSSYFPECKTGSAAFKSTLMEFSFSQHPFQAAVRSAFFRSGGAWRKAIMFASVS